MRSTDPKRAPIQTSSLAGETGVIRAPRGAAMSAPPRAIRARRRAAPADAWRKGGPGAGSASRGWAPDLYDRARACQPSRTSGAWSSHAPWPGQPEARRSLMSSHDLP